MTFDRTGCFLVGNFDMIVDYFHVAPAFQSLRPMIAQVGRHLQRLGQRLAAITIVLTEQNHRFIQVPVHQAIANTALAKIGLMKPFQFGTFLEI